MANKAAQLILDALSRAAIQPQGAPLHGNKRTPGLFPPTAAGRQAAQQCKAEGWLRVVATEQRGKTMVETCAITDRGQAHLMAETSPRQMLQDLTRALEQRQAQWQDMVNACRQTQLGLEDLRQVTMKVLERINGAPLPGQTPNTGASHAEPVGDWETAALQHLARWQAAGALEDCPLPALYRHVAQSKTGLTVGRFHDGLRILHERGRIYLHPWTGPLYDMPEPRYALMIGHEILYYASSRQAAGRTTGAGAAAGAAGAAQIPYYEYAGTD